MTEKEYLFMNKTKSNSALNPVQAVVVKPE